MKIDKKQIVQAFEKEVEIVMEIESIDKREEFLSKEDEALEALSPITTEENTATGNGI